VREAMGRKVGLLSIRLPSFTREVSRGGCQLLLGRLWHKL
jgi:hypothetical protein